MFWGLQCPANTRAPSPTLQTLHKGKKEDGKRSECTHFDATTTLQHSKRKCCLGRLSGGNRDCYSQMAASSRSPLRANKNNKIAKKDRKRRQAEMHNAGERLQLTAPSSGP